MTSLSTATLALRWAAHEIRRLEAELAQRDAFAAGYRARIAELEAERHAIATRLAKATR